MVGSAWIERTTVEQALWEASVANGYVAKDGRTEAWNTLTSGLIAGIANPRTALFDAPIFNETTLAAIQRMNPTIDNVPLPQGPNKFNVEVVTMSAIIAEKTDWLWEGYLPKGKLTLLAGAAGTGKSTIAFSMAATVSNGSRWPDQTLCKTPGNVLVFSTEDDAGDTIKPRLLAMDANVNRVALVSSTTRPGQGKLPFDPATDMPALKAYALANGVFRCSSSTL